MRATRPAGWLVICVAVALAACDGDPPVVTDQGLGSDGTVVPDRSLVDQGKVVDTGVGQDGVAPDAGVADVGAADGPVTTPDAAQPDMAQPDMAQPDMAQPDMLQPDMLQPDMLQPDMLQPDMAIPTLTVAVSYPPRAAMLDGAQTITVQGQITGPLWALDSLKVNGKVVNPNGNGSFSTPMTSAWGLNILTVEVTDKAARVENVAQSYHWSPKYWPMGMSSPAQMAVTKAAGGRLYQKAIDDGNRSDLNDLATIMEKVINAVNLDAQIPSTLASGKYKIPPWGPTVSWSAKKNGKLTYSPFKISLAARTGGIRLSGSTSSMSLPVKASASVLGSISGTVSITGLSLKSDVNISKSSGGSVNVSVASISMNYSSLKVNISGWTGAVLNPLINAITSLFKNTIIKAFENEIKKQIPGPVKSFVSGFKFGTSFTLPPELGSKKINVYSALDTIAFDNYGGNIWLLAAVYGAKGIPDGKKGSISGAGTYTPPTTSSDAMAVALRYDALNQALGAAWYAGALKGDFSKLLLSAIGSGSMPFAISGLKFKVDAMLPPILMDGTTGHDFDIGVGDLKLEAELTLPASGSTPAATITAEGYVSAVMGGDISMSSKGELTIQLANSLKKFEIQLTKLAFSGTGIPSLGAISLALKQLVTQLLPQVLPVIIQKFPIPAIDLSALGGQYGIPAGTVLKVSNVSLSQKNYHLVLSGQLK